MCSLKNVCPIGPAVWPAIAKINTYTHLYIYMSLDTSYSMYSMDVPSTELN